MEFTKADVEKLAALSRLALTDQEKEKYVRQLSSIVDYVAKIQELPLMESDEQTEVRPSRLREDITEPFENPHELLKASPAVHESLVEVKRVFE